MTVIVKGFDCLTLSSSLFCGFLLEISLKGEQQEGKVILLQKSEKEQVIILGVISEEGKKFKGEYNFVKRFGELKQVF